MKKILLLFLIKIIKINHYEKIKFEYVNEEKEIEFNMLAENNDKNNFIIYLISISYPGLIISKDLEIDIREPNHLFNNFIKNRAKDLISIEEFKENYGLDENIDELKETHKHIN